MDLVEEQLRNSKTIAVVGLSPNPDRDSHRVSAYMQSQGYRIIPVNPTVDEVLGEKSYPDLASVPEPIDMVDIFPPVGAGDAGSGRSDPSGGALHLDAGRGGERGGR